MHPATLEGNVWIQRIPVKEWYTVQETSLILAMGTTQIYSSINREAMIGHRVNGTTMVKHDNLVAYIGKRRQEGVTVKQGEYTIERIWATPRANSQESASPVTQQVVVRRAPEEIGEVPVVVQAEVVGTEGGLDLDSMDLDE